MQLSRARRGLGGCRGVQEQTTLRLPINELASLISTQRSFRRRTEAGASKGQEEALQSSRIAVDALARLHIFNLNYSGAPPAHGVDGVYAEPSIADEP